MRVTQIATIVHPGKILSAHISFPIVSPARFSCVSFLSWSLFFVRQRPDARLSALFFIVLGVLFLAGCLFHGLGGTSGCRLAFFQDLELDGDEDVAAAEDELERVARFESAQFVLEEPARLHQFLIREEHQVVGKDAGRGGETA